MHPRPKIAWWYLTNMPMDELTPTLVYEEPDVLGAELRCTRLQRSYACVVRLPARKNIKRLVYERAQVALNIRNAELARSNYVQNWQHSMANIDRARVNVLLGETARELLGRGVACVLSCDFGGNGYGGNEVLIVNARFRTGQALRLAIPGTSFVTNRSPYEWLERYVVDNILSAVRQNPGAFVAFNPPSVAPQLLHFSAV